MGFFDKAFDMLNKAELSISPNTKLKTISNNFKKKFNLTLVFYKGARVAEGNLTINQLSKKVSKDVTKFGSVKIKGSMKVGVAEDHFLNAFGLKVQIKDKTGKVLVPNGISIGQAARGKY